MRIIHLFSRVGFSAVSRARCRARRATRDLINTTFSRPQPITLPPIRNDPVENNAPGKWDSLFLSLLSAIARPHSANFLTSMPPPSVCVFNPLRRLVVISRRRRRCVRACGLDKRRPLACPDLVLCTVTCILVFDRIMASSN